MRTIRFQSRRGLIVVKCRIWGRRVSRDLWLALDTGCAPVLVTPNVIDQIGYSVRDAAKIATVRSILEVEHGFVLNVIRFAALGHHQRDFPVHVHDLPDEWDDLDGLLGQRFLSGLNYEIRSKEHRVRAERA